MRVVVALVGVLVLFVSPAYAAAPNSVTVEEGHSGEGTVDVSAGTSGRTSATAPPRREKRGTSGGGGGEVEAPIECVEGGTFHFTDCSVATPTFGAPPPGRPPAPPVDRRQYAIDYFRSLPLPRPAPEISAKAGGITGATHSLDLRVPQQVVFTDPETPFGPLVVHAYATFVVAWGDGTTGTYTDAGAPYPRSDITHSWERRGTYDITVTARWTADWSYGDFSGSVRGVSTTGTIAEWPVIELQAVITG